MVVTTVLEVRRERGIFQDELELRGLMMTNTLNEVLADPLYNSDIDGLADIAFFVTSQSDTQYVEVLAPDGRILVDTRQGEYPTGAASEFALRGLRNDGGVTRTEGDSFQIAAPLKVGDELLGGVRFGFDSSGIDSKVSTIVFERIWETLILISVGVALAYIVAQYFVRPLRRLVRATGKVAEGRYEFSGLGGRHDEIGELSDAFQEMTRQLQAGTVDLKTANENLARLNEELESRVEERTAELGTANRNLVNEITERREAEEEIRRLALAISNVGDGVTITDVDGDLLFVNPAVERMLGYERSELMGEPISRLYPGGPQNPTLEEIMTGMRSGGGGRERWS